MIQGLSGKADGSKDGTVTIRELASYVQKEVPILSEAKADYKHSPMFYSEGYDFAIGRNF